MSYQTPTRRALAALLLLLSACSDFWGEGPNPRDAGRYQGVVPAAGSSGVSGNGSSGGSGQACLADQGFSALLAENGANCEPVKGCMLEHCSPELEACLGLGFRGNDLDGGKCSDYTACLESCQCEPNCSNGCRPLSAPCDSCLGTLVTCEQSSCLQQVDACQGMSGVVTLAANLGTNINDLAVDGDYVYFTTNQGVAKVLKTGGAAVPLTGMMNVMGLAVQNGSAYVVENSGSVTRMTTDGKGAMVLVPAAMNSGSNALVVDSQHLFYTVGPYLRRAALDGSGPATLSADNWQGGSSAHRLALDATTIYYAGGNQGPISLPELRMLEKTAPAVSDNLGPDGGAKGATLVQAKGEIRAVVSDGEFVYFTDVSSDGLAPLVELIKLVPATKKVTTIASSKPTAGNPGGNVGGSALATDGTHVYFGGASGLLKVTVDGTELETLVADAMPTALAIDDRYLYWNEQNGNSALKKIARR